MDDAGKELLAALHRKYDTPFYLYDEAVIDAQADALLNGFPDFEILYSIKTNPFSPVAGFIFSKGIGADAASAAEVDLAHGLGVPPGKVLYSAAGKTESDIRRTLDKAVIIADSYRELRLLDSVAASENRRLEVGLRINPVFSMTGGAGASSKFGVDAESIPAHLDMLRGLANIAIVGIHVHVRSQILDEGQLHRYFENIFRLAAECRDAWGWAPQFINFGGGLGIPYAPADVPLDIPRLGAACAKLAAAFSRDTGIRLIIESGRFLVGAAGKYAMPIIDIKESRGKKYLIVRNGLNGFLRPAVSALLQSVPNGRLDAFAAEPLFTTADAFALELVGSGTGEAEEVAVVGNLCTAIDVVSAKVALPPARIGDLIVASNAGSYACSLSPLLFSSHTPPLQIYLDRSGDVMVGDGRLG